MGDSVIETESLPKVLKRVVAAAGLRRALLAWWLYCDFSLCRYMRSQPSCLLKLREWWGRGKKCLR